MTDSTTVDVNDDLDAFSDELFGTKPEIEAEVPDNEPESEEDTETPSATEVAESDTVEESEETSEEESDGDDAPADEETEDEDEEDEGTPVLKVRGRKSARERINELTAKAREAERRAEAAERALEARSQEAKQPVQKDAAPLEAEAPSPDAVKENGDPVYPLGEFDPHYIRDLTKFTIAQEAAVARQEAEEARRREEVESAERELLTSWTEKLDKASERLPDLREKTAELEETFSGLDPNYGKYLAATIMSLDYGPDVLDYLADNVAEARRIVAAGPTQATIALGRLEARFAVASEKSNEVEKGKVKPTKAATPPPTNRGSGSSRSIKPDTDDLEAFEKVYYRK